MTAIATFLTRKAGGRRANWLDWLTYAYLFSGFLMIVVPVMWLALNSLKSASQLEKQDLSLLPSSFESVARATVSGPDGKEIFFIQDLPDWVLNWNDLSDEQKAGRDIPAFLAAWSGNELYALRSQLGYVPTLVRDMVAAQDLPEWLLRYPSMSVSAKQDFDPTAVIATLAPEDQRLLSEFLGIGGYEPSRLALQVLVRAPDPETGEETLFGISNFKATRALTPARYVDNRSEDVVRLNTAEITMRRQLDPSWNNFSDPLTGNAFGVNVNFATCFTNSVLVTLIATVLTLLINSMAAFSLAKYKFRGQVAFFIVILATLMVPPTITLVGVFKAVNATGLSGSIWGVIIPGAATPTGVFLLRQYMLSIPDELIEAARMDAASEWKVYWRIVLPLAMPALAALGILSIIWRWNDLILPLVAIATTKEAYTIQLCLLEFRGEHLSQEHYRLAMTMVSLVPSTLVFVFLQKYITTGIANTGLK
ncbi:carbohydrate ABC transporter membrane protein 2, CUT1 family [Yoonia tamlensis]|uniref:Carbohydrate ABC transporter membrane protein 2, CUT1 family n=1 Tax=Yoonia tamlensis TaxID=390270 RepID=A0A1I6HGH4_9RHOB|nr:carbohydrate ABC transporter permease [Yoonia tamlensis]SFR53357.1 carbohydrate ABC transporter membrane protein 2, CUT1 family [Yoonia tamlensis]